MSAAAIDNAPECQTCDGHCCEKFYGFTERTGKPWQRKHAEKRIGEKTPWEISGELEFVGKQIRANCRCSHHGPAGCAIYETRPLACRHFPLPEVVLQLVETGVCALATSLARLHREQLMLRMV